MTADAAYAFKTRSRRKIYHWNDRCKYTSQAHVMEANDPQLLKSNRSDVFSPVAEHARHPDQLV
jgi:hypothetical protein